MHGRSRIAFLRGVNLYARCMMMVTRVRCEIVAIGSRRVVEAEDLGGCIGLGYLTVMHLCERA